MTGSHVGATLNNHLFARASAGYDIRVSFFLGYFIFWTSKKEVSRHRGETKPKKHWIPVCTGMTVVYWVLVAPDSMSSCDISYIL